MQTHIGSASEQTAPPEKTTVSESPLNRRDKTSPLLSAGNSSKDFPNCSLMASGNDDMRYVAASKGSEKSQQGTLSGVDWNVILAPLTSLIDPHKSTSFSPWASEKCKRKGLDALFQLFSSAIALSREEVMFIHLVMQVGPEKAIEIRASPFVKLLRPLRAVLSGSIPSGTTHAKRIRKGKRN